MSFVQGVGLALVALVTADAAVTVLHPDAEGVLAKGIRRGVWRMTVLVSTGVPRIARQAHGLAGPVIVVMTSVAWIALVTLGVALVTWPMLDDDFAVEAGLRRPLTFLDALYFAAGTVSVLGYGDLTPLSTGGQVISVSAAAIGLTMFTGMVTYTIQIVSGVAARNKFTLAVHDDLQGPGGASMLAQCLAAVGTDDARERCRAWAEHLREVDQMVHRYPLVAFTYRSHRPEYDPEPALRHVAEAAVTALVAAARDPSLRATAQSLSSALARLQITIAATYLSRDTAGQLADPRPTADDRRAVANIDRLLTTHLGRSHPQLEHDQAARAVRRSRVFLAGLHHWSRTETPSHEWDT